MSKEKKNSKPISSINIDEIILNQNINKLNPATYLKELHTMVKWYLLQGGKVSLTFKIN